MVGSDSRVVAMFVPGARRTGPTGGGVRQDGEADGVGGTIAEVEAVGRSRGDTVRNVSGK